MKRLRISLFSVGLLLIIGSGKQEAFALAGTLDRPSLSFPAAMGKSKRSEIMKAISDEIYQFKGGRFVNASTTLDYAGNMEALNQFLERLAKCSGILLDVNLHARGQGEGISWRLQHSAWGDAKRMTVLIYENGEAFDRLKLMLPDGVRLNSGVATSIVDQLKP